jgi:hypothetical protein
MPWQQKSPEAAPLHFNGLDIGVAQCAEKIDDE